MCKITALGGLRRSGAMMPLAHEGLSRPCMRPLCLRSAAAQGGAARADHRPKSSWVAGWAWQALWDSVRGPSGSRCPNRDGPVEILTHMDVRSNEFLYRGCQAEDSALSFHGEQKMITSSPIPKSKPLPLRRCCWGLSTRVRHSWWLMAIVRGPSATCPIGNLS